MIKKRYMKPSMEVIEADVEQQILAGSVQTTGLGDDNLTQDDENPSGDSWNDAMSRRNVWDE